MAIPEEEVIFNSARQIREEVARRVYLEQACAGDVALRARIESLLRVYDQDLSFLKPQHNGTRTATEASLEPGPGAVIGPYKLIEQIGEGGMGIVFRAEQTDPIQRQVALKIIKAGMDSRHVIARFEAERQALALMDHPNMAKVIDAGATNLGRPYFVMELIEGVPITRYCDAHHLTPKERLELFIPVCLAVQHAHQKGIIHRDLKPSNVMITQRDDRPVPKIIDFGVAKAVSQKLTENTLFTAQGHIVGTLAYMSPEQAEPNQRDIDTRSDIYSLGVLLYELLTGTTPFDGARFQEMAWAELLRVLREVEPPKPSTRLSHTDELPSIAANRGIEPKRLTGLVRGDLDWIVMKSLEKDRACRYATANGLARDIERFLCDEPVEAGPPSTGYKLRKFLRRNKGPVVAASLLLLAMVCGTIGTAVGLVQANRERVHALEAAESERLANELAQRRLKQIEKGNEILGTVFQYLDPTLQRNSNMSLWVHLGERLEAAAKQLEGESIGDPVVVARLQRVLGRSMLSLGFNDKAIELLNKAHATLTTQVGPDNAETIRATNMLGLAYRSAGKNDVAIPLLKEALERAKRTHGPDDDDTITYMSNLGTAYRSAKRCDLAIPLLEESLKLWKAKVGVEDTRSMLASNNLAVAYIEARKVSLALSLLEDLYPLRLRLSGADHVETLAVVHNLATCYNLLGKSKSALTLYEDTHERLTAKIGPDHPNTLTVLQKLALLHWQLAMKDSALQLSLEAAKRVEKRKFENDLALAIVDQLCTCYEGLNRPDQSEEWRRKFMAVVKEKHGPNSIRYADELCKLVSALHQEKKWTEAETAGRESLALLQRLEPDAWTTFNVESILGAALVGQKRYTEAEALLVAGYHGMKDRESTMPRNRKDRLTGAIERLVRLYEGWDKPDEAEKWRKLLPQTKP